MLLQKIKGYSLERSCTLTLPRSFFYVHYDKVPKLISMDRVIIKVIVRVVVGRVAAILEN